jgi:centromeric protein E
VNALTMTGEELMVRGGTPGSNGQEERIFVSVRVRPLNEKEILRNDASDWECVNGNSIKFKHNLPDRALFPSSYTYGNQACSCFISSFLLINGCSVS